MSLQHITIGLSLISLAAALIAFVASLRDYLRGRKITKRIRPF